MEIVIVTGCYGLVGSEICIALADNGYQVIGIDCDIRSSLFEGIPPLTESARRTILPNPDIQTYDIDIRNVEALSALFHKLQKTAFIKGVIHTAAQPSHDWAANQPFVDFDINAKGTLNLLQVTREAASDALFVHMSTNKVYGDTPNSLGLTEYKYRYDVSPDDKFYDGINESMSIDNTKHSLFGVSKVAADLYVQEYARYFNMKTVVLRGGCLTGAKHRGHRMHGFLNYLIRCALTNTQYTICGYKGKQVRDNLDSRDIAQLILKMFDTQYFSSHNNGDGRIFNMGGGRANSVSILEAITLMRQEFNLRLSYHLSDINRQGDHIWYISDNTKLSQVYNWQPTISINEIIESIIKELYV